MHIFKSSFLIKLYTTAIATFFTFFAETSAFACDYCGIYTPLQVRERQAGQLDMGIRQDLIGYSKTRLDGGNAPGLGSQNIKINVTELTAQYSLTNRFSLLLAVPLINENFKRRIQNGIERGSDSGIGEVALYTDFTLARKALTNGGYFQWDFFAGVKLPTGSSDALNELPPVDAQSGIYQSALAIGSGSVDFPIATGIRRETRNWLLDASIQYNLRTEGDYNYQIGNDLRWEFGIGKRFIEEDSFAINTQIFLSGLTKEQDTQSGQDITNSGRSFLSIGPKIEATWSNKYTVFGRIDVPLTMDNDGLQNLQDHRGVIGFNVRL